MSQRMIDVRPGCFCQPVRWLECLMFSLLVALLCIFLCQRRWAIWTARALQRPAGHPSSPWRPECSASAECWWFVMTWEPADRQVSYKKTWTHFPFVVQRKHRCSCNVVVVGGAHDCHRRLAPDSCVISLICRQVDVKYFVFFFCLNVDFGTGVIHSHGSPSAAKRHEEQSWKGISILRHIFIFIISPRLCMRHVMALSREHHGKNADGCKGSRVMKSERWDAKDKRRGKQNPKSQFFSQALCKIDCFLLI